MSINDSEKRQQVLSDILEKLSELNNLQKENLCREIAIALGFDYESILKSRQFGLMSFDEIHNANYRGLDIQLHTHTHNIDIKSPEKIIEEIDINRKKYFDINVR